MILLIQSMVFLYSLVSMLSKIASGYLGEDGIFSFPFLALFFSMVVGMGIYAILWQQVLKKAELTEAYVHKSMTLFWSLLWAVVLFQETIHWNNIAGIVIVVAGIVLVTKDD